MDDVVKQFSCFLCYSLDLGFVFDPLGEFVNADIDPVKPLGIGLNGLIISSSQHAKGHDTGIVCKT